jgi:hypothetical protein
MTMRIKGSPESLRKLAERDPNAVPSVGAKAKEHGAISHHFYGTADEILIVDEWPDEASFRAFFEASPEIGGFMAEAGVTAAPTQTFWQKLDLGDDIG